MQSHFSDFIQHSPRFLRWKPAFILLSILVLSTGCFRRSAEVTPDASFSRYITSFTSGPVSVDAPVVIRLSRIPPVLEPGQALPSGVVKLRPSVKGETLFESGGIIRFRPDSPLKRGIRYSVDFDLGSILDVEKPFRLFRFDFSTMSQDFTVEDEGLHAGAALGYQGFSHSGRVTTADGEVPELVESMVSASYNRKKVPLSWVHSSDRRVHTFSADSLMRSDTSPGELKVEWNGKPLSLKKKGGYKSVVPPLGVFTILNTRLFTTPEQRIEVVFSDPPARDADLSGFVTLGDNLGFTWQIDGNHLLLWPVEKIRGASRLLFHRGLFSSEGNQLSEDVEVSLFFRNLPPEVRLLGKGVIVPEGGSLILPFEAVTLSAIDLRIIKVYADNMRQFLQGNQVDGEEYLKEVGHLVYSGKVELQPDNPKQLFQWSTYKIELDRFLTPEPGALYRVELRFRREYSLYECEESFSSDDYEFEARENWDTPGWYSISHWPAGYDWDERNNPCHVSYYNSGRFVWRNILASDLGILAKEGTGNHYTFVVTSLKSSSPVDQARIEIFDLQHQLLGKITTGSQGIGTITLMKKPFVAVVTKGNQTGYLRLDNASSLSLSNFDISGVEITEGVKGFIYGERGVWRPGDPIFLTFILDDPEKRLPPGAPVIFKLTNSRGQEVEKRVATAGENGFYHFPVTTREDDPTGNWHVRIEAGGAVFEKRVKIETVKPNRLKVNLALPPLITAGIADKAKLSSAWLHGTPAASLRAVVESEMFPVKTTFKGYEGFSFDDPSVVWTPSKDVVFEGTLDSQGQTEVPLNFPEKRGVPGKMKAWFTTRVFEQGGDFSTRVQETLFSPYNKYLGIKMPDEADGWYQTGKVYFPELVAVSAAGQPLPLGRVEVSLFKIGWRWWWESGEDHLAHYVSGTYHKPLKVWSFQSAGNREQFQLKVDAKDWSDTGRYLLFARDMNSGHSAGVVFYMSEWGDWQSAGIPDGATILSLQTDKEKYAPGDKIRVTFPSLAGSRVLVSLEDGRQVKDIFWVKTSEGLTWFEVDVKPGMAPTLYVHVTLLQPYGSARNDAPLRLYGVKAVTVEDPATRLEPEIIIDPELKPEKDFKLVVKEKKGKEMTYTVAIVDEGLLDLTGFSTPDPHAWFYAREALGVRSYDMFDYVAGAYGAQLEKAFAVGGDQELRVTGHQQVNRFMPVVLFAGPFTLKGGSKSHTFKMPNYVGSVRAMVIAGSSGAYGHAEKSVPVRMAVMALATLPRVAAPGEEIALAADIFALKESTREVTVTVETNSMLSVTGNRSKTISFTAPGEKMEWFRLKAADATGVARVKVTAVSGGESAEAEVSMEIRNPNPPVTIEKSSLLAPGATMDETLNLPGMAGTNEAFLELSVIPGMNLSRHLDHLTRYPHGCTEQIISTAMGQLFLGSLMPLESSEKSAIESHVREVLQKLRGVQTADGGFALWPGQNTPDPWVSGYAGHFMLLAAQKGYSVAPEMKNRWLSYQKRRASEWKMSPAAELFVKKQETLIQAYRLYTLALARKGESGIMNRFREEVAAYPEARWRLAAAYLLMGQSSAAEQLLGSLKPESDIYEQYGPTFGSALRDKAMFLETLLLKGDRVGAFSLVREMAETIGNSEWLSTQTAAWSFYVIARFFETLPGKEGMDASVTIDGKREVVKRSQPVVRLPVPETGVARVAATVVNQGDGPLYSRLVARGIPLEDTSGAQAQNLKISSSFTGRDGKAVSPLLLPQGSDLTLQVTVTHPGNRGAYNDLVLTTIFPSGWEILNRRLHDLPEGSRPGFDYQDIRDDRVYTFFSLRPGESRSFQITLNAAYEGRFLMPALLCEGMYDHSVYARQPGGWVQVVRE